MSIFPCQNITQDLKGPITILTKPFQLHFMIKYIPHELLINAIPKQRAHHGSGITPVWVLLAEDKLPSHNIVHAVGIEQQDRAALT